MDTKNKTQKDSKNSIRPPIVVVMGHIDHGKSQILETIRQTKMLEKEAGGITQHIGAYEVEHKGKKITFIDTPGHEAFSKLRSRGAKVADIAVLVVAADEGVKPQTLEAITIIKENNLPFVVALNKIDKPEANPAKVKQELAENGILVESYGGKIPSAEISAKTGKNLDELLEIILLVAELEELKADFEAKPEGVVVETRRDSKRGNSATLLVRNGSLKRGDILVIGRTIEVVKILEDFRGKPSDRIMPSSPALVAGLSKLPVAGDKFCGFSSRKEAEEFIETLPEEKIQAERLFVKPQTDKIVFNLILKTDVAGSKEALEDVLLKIESERLKINILRSEIGDINESDVKLALATKLVTIVGFKVSVDSSAQILAEKENIRILTGEVIYELLEEIKKTIEDMLPPEIKRTELGRVKTLKIFKKEGKKQIIGGRVEDGLIKNGAAAEIKRRDEIVGKGAILELQQNKQQAREVEKGFEFGALVESDTEILEGDVLVIYEEEIIKQKI